MPKNSRRNRINAIVGEKTTSTYGAKLRRWGKEAKEEETQPSYQNETLAHEETQPSYQNETLAHEGPYISTKVSYIKNHSGPGVRISPNKEEPMISSFLATRKNYRINKHCNKGYREKPIVSTSFEGLYNDTWIKENKPAGLELRAIERKFQTKRKAIDDYLKIKI